jgi:hypothetical protein
MANRTNHDQQNATQKTNRNPNNDREVNSSTLEGWPVPAPLVAPVVLLLNNTNIMWYWNPVEHQFTKQRFMVMMFIVAYCNYLIEWERKTDLSELTSETPSWRHNGLDKCH